MAEMTGRLVLQAMGWEMLWGSRSLDGLCKGRSAYGWERLSRSVSSSVYAI